MNTSGKASVSSLNAHLSSTRTKSRDYIDSSLPGKSTPKCGKFLSFNTPSSERCSMSDDRTGNLHSDYSAMSTSNKASVSSLNTHISSARTKSRDYIDSRFPSMSTSKYGNFLSVNASFSEGCSRSDDGTDTLPSTYNARRYTQGRHSSRRSTRMSKHPPPSRIFRKSRGTLGPVYEVPQSRTVKTNHGNQGNTASLVSLLPRCLSDINTMRPSDVNGFMAQWLYKAVDNGENREIQKTTFQDTTALMVEIRKEETCQLERVRKYIEETKDILGRKTPQKNMFNDDLDSMMEQFRARQRSVYEEQARKMIQLGKVRSSLGERIASNPNMLKDINVDYDWSGETRPKHLRVSLRQKTLPGYDHKVRLINEMGVADEGCNIDEQDGIIDNQGKITESLGSLINEKDRIIDEMGQLVDKDGRLLDMEDFNDEKILIDKMDKLTAETGRLTDANDFKLDDIGRRIDEKGRLIDENGRLIDKFGRLVDENGTLIDTKDFKFDKMGRMVDEKNRLIDKMGRLIDDSGRLIDGNNFKFIDIVRMLDEKCRAADEKGELSEERRRLLDEMNTLVSESRESEESESNDPKTDKLIDKKGRKRNKMDTLVEESERLINEKGKLLDEKGRLIDEKGKSINDNDKLIRNKNTPIIDQKRLIIEKHGLVVAKGRLIDKHGRLINEGGLVHYQEGRRIDYLGRFVDSEGNLVSDDKPRLTLTAQQLKAMITTWRRNANKKKHAKIVNMLDQFIKAKKAQKEEEMARQFGVVGGRALNPKNNEWVPLSRFQSKTSFNTPQTLNQSKTSFNTPLTVNQSKTSFSTPLTVNQSTTSFNTPLTQSKTSFNTPLTLNQSKTSLYTPPYLTQSKTSFNTPLTLNQSKTSLYTPPYLNQSKTSFNTPLSRNQSKTDFNTNRPNPEHLARLLDHLTPTEIGTESNKKSDQKFVCENEYNSEYYTVCWTEDLIFFDYKSAGTEPMALADFDFNYARHKIKRVQEV